MPLSPDPVLLAGFAVSAVLYVRAVRILRRRGVRVGRWQQASWWTGWALFAIALVGPIDPLGEELFSFHMAQHLLIADAGAPLLLLGIRWPVHLFLLPRPLLVALARRRGFRTAFRTLRQPLVAIPIFVGTLFFWHWEPAFTTAIREPSVHALQHQSFVGASILVWWSALEPHRRRMRGELWKIGHLVGARLPGMFLGMFFIFMRQPAYGEVYGQTAPAHGLTPLADQQSAGGLMLSADFVLLTIVLAVFFWRAAEDDAARTVGRDEPTERPRIVSTG